MPALAFYVIGNYAAISYAIKAQQYVIIFEYNLFERRYRKEKGYD